MKKGQITMFVIIGAVLLLAAGMFFFISSELSKDKPVLDVPDVSLETRPAAQLIESCLESTTEQAIRLVSAQGGYLTAPRPNYFPSRGASIIVEPNTIPFWRYMEEENCLSAFGCPASEQPPLCKLSSSDRCSGMSYGSNSIEEHIEEYVLANIDDCLGDLVSISDFYDVELSDEREVEIFFKEGSTSIVLTNELTTTSRSTSNTKSLEQFRAVLDVDMLELYRIASETVDFIRASNYYERQTMDLVTVYSCNEPSCLPPTDQLSLDFVTTNFWVQQIAKTTMETEVLPLMSLVRFVNFDNYALLERPEGEDFAEYNPYIDGLYGSFSPKLSDERFIGYDLNHYYLYDSIKFQIDDGKQIIKPKDIDMSSLGLIEDILPLGFADMRFNYFMTYPLLLNIKDKEAFNGEGLDFNFAIEVNIAANRPAYENITIYNTGAPVGVSLADTENLVQRDITIQSFDKYTRQPINDVIVSYVCLDEYKVGVTSYTPEGSAELVTKLPHCEFGGFLTFSRNGYAKEVVAFNNPENSADTKINAELWPLKEREIIVYKRSTKDVYDVFSAGDAGIFELEDAYSKFNETQSVMVLLNKDKETPYDDNIPTVGFGMVDGHIDYNQFLKSFNPQEQLQIIEQLVDNGELDAQEAQELTYILENYEYPLEAIDTLEAQPIVMDLVPGKYLLELTMFDYGFEDEDGVYHPAVEIPHFHQEFSTGFLGLGKKEDIDLPAQNFSTWVTGGGIINISISEEFLYESDEPIIFYAIEIPKPTKWNCENDYAVSLDSVCSDFYGYCGTLPGTPGSFPYCVSFDQIQEISEYQQGKEFLLTQGLNVK